MPQLILGDCLEVLRAYPDNYFDSVVCDPPYGLSAKQPDMIEVLRHWLAGDAYEHKGTGFMGAKWDAGVPGPEYWREVLRVLKPGGYLLAFAGSRTVDLMGLAIRLAGFEIRDQLQWIYGQGFPKSSDISKSIDKARDDTAEVRVVCRWLRARIEKHPTHTARSIADAFGFVPGMVGHWTAKDSYSQPSLPTLEQWDRLKGLLGFGPDMDARVLRLNLRKGLPGEAWADRPVTGEVQEWANRTNYALTSADGLRRDIPATPEAEQWAGWGTALKPGHEPIVMARKPFRGPVFRQVLATGTGALNIDGCRIGSEGGVRKIPGTIDRSGRWPANVLLDEGAAAMLDAQAGPLKSGSRRQGVRKGLGYHGAAGDGGPAIEASEGGPSRFFYCAKARKKERKAGAPEGCPAHPTVKPIEVMRWLVRLVTPPGGRVLDPFGGSGSTGIAALFEGFDPTVIELDPLHAELAASRMAHAAAADGLSRVLERSGREHTGD